MATTLDSAARGAARAHSFYLLMAIGFVAVVLAGFSSRYYVRLAGIEAATPIVHVHAALFSAWFVLLIGQASLVGAGRVDLHRRLGLAAVVLVPAMVAVGLVTAIQAARAGWNPANVGTPVGFMALGVIDTLLFGAFATAALLLRRRPDVHKRLLMLASVALLWAAVTRLPAEAGTSAPPVSVLIGIVLLYVLLAFAGPIYDFATRRRVSRLEIVGGVVLIAGRPLARVLGGTQVWQTFGGWLIG